MIKFPSICSDGSISEKVYRDHRALNYSTVKDHSHQNTPAHFFSLRLDPDRPEEFQGHKSTSAMEIGTAVHVGVLQPDEFHKQYALAPCSDSRTKKYKEAIKANPEKMLLKPSDWDQVQQMVESVRNHMGASFLLNKGKAEVPMFWRDENGTECKALMDWLRPDHIIVDLKTTQDASDGFRGARYQIERQFLYGWQLAHYTQGYEIITGFKPEFVFLMVENKYPYAVRCLTYSDQKKQQFIEEFEQAKAQYLEAQSNNWPGYSQIVEEIA